MEQVGWEKFLKQPIGTGPYRVDGEVKDYRKVAEGEVYARLSANLDYWNAELPKIRTITFIQHSSKEALQALLEGRIDLVTSLIPKDTLKIAENPNLMVIKGREEASFTSGFLNLRSIQTFPLRDIRVRKALNYAINREELLRYAFKGNGVRMKGVLTEKSGVDLSGTDPYEWDVQKARELLEWAGYGDGFSIKLFCHEKDYLIGRLLQRFYKMLGIQVEIKDVPFEWIVEHIIYPSTRDDYSWDDEDWWIVIYSQPPGWPEVMYTLLNAMFHYGAPWQTSPDWLMYPLNEMYVQVLRSRDREKRFQIYRDANEYIADQAFHVFTVAPLGLYGVNKEFEFVPHISQYLYLEYSSVTDRHWSILGKND
jgi:ABC-type transport system substrate-binding protein